MVSKQFDESKGKYCPIHFHRGYNWKDMAR
jgi:hypothetical protein